LSHFRSSWTCSRPFGSALGLSSFELLSGSFLSKLRWLLDAGCRLLTLCEYHVAVSLQPCESILNEG
jgi:hypothetical protein